MAAGLLLSTALVALSAVFAGVYVLAWKIDNYGIVDIAWSYAFAALALFYAVFGPGWILRRVFVAVLASVWSARLGTHLYRRVMGHHPIEDSRYRQLRHDWATRFDFKMGLFFQSQAWSVVVLGVVFLLPALNPAPQLHSVELGGAALVLFAVLGEARADAQLARFKRETLSKNEVCRIGLWRFSRHPNYFFEWLTWVGFFVFALPSPLGALAAVGPLAILYLLLRVTGIPLAEQQSLRSKGDAYREYQRTTSGFVPWFPQKRPRLPLSKT